MSTHRRTLFSCPALLFALFFVATATAEVKLLAPAGYLPGRPFPVRVEARDATGQPDRNLWDGVALLSADNPAISLSTNRVALRNGVGTALVTIAGDTPFILRAAMGAKSGTVPVRNRFLEPVMTVNGTLAGASSSWSGVVQVTGNITVPAGHVLTLQPDTLVLINGVASGTSGIRIAVDGSIRSLGTEGAPVTITCADPAQNWGQISHRGEEPSIYQHTYISKAGRVAGEGHTGAGPALRPSNTLLTLEDCVVSDLTAGETAVGKIMMASGSSLTFRNCIFARARMGPEIQSTGLLCENSYFTDMRGPDDADGIYLHEAENRELRIENCVFAGGDDDAVDTLNSRVTIENSILRDWPNPNEDAKGVSAFNGEVILERCLIVNCFVGVATKSNGPLGIIRIDHCTINGLTRGVSAATKSNATAGNLQVYITNSIVRADDALHSDFGADRFVTVAYNNLGEAWPGAGNQTSDPLFINAAAGDFHLRSGSPCIDAGDPASPPDGDFSRTDIGFHAALVALATGDIVISEIMYHPASENPMEEFIELHNRGTAPVNLSGWRFTDGVSFTFPSVTIPAEGYLAVAADLETFRNKYPTIANVVGNWTGTLSNSREDIDLDDASGARVDSVRYADEGDWAVRQRGELDRNQRGWIWHAGHDGLGKSAELINAGVSNNNGQNWGSSLALEGTPGRPNTVAASLTPPIIENVAHFPLVPKSLETVSISAKLSGAAETNLVATLFYRLDGIFPAPFSSVPMRDDGQNGDPAAGDALFTAILPGQTSNSVVEFYISASDSAGRTRFWPSPAIAALDGTGPAGQVANALYQVDDGDISGTQPLYKIILREEERATLALIGSGAGGSANSDAQMNATFLSVDGTGSELHYLAGVRNRGHGSRIARPNNFRVNFRSDQPWKGVLAINLNAQYSWLQVLGAALHLKSGSIGAYSRAVQLRVNNGNLVFTGGIERTYGSYAANEVIDADWADRHFPNDSNGNVYRANRDIAPIEFDYRTLEAYPGLYGPENKDSYTNTWFKTTNVSEDDWSDLIGMLKVMGTNGIIPFTAESVRNVIHPEQWLRHLAMMNLLGNGETGLNGGLNDDYFMYAGGNDPRFVLVYYDLDQILGFNNSFSTTSQVFSAEINLGAGRAMGRLLRHPEFEPLYYEALRELIETTFSAAHFNATVDQVLGDFVPLATRNQLKGWMDQRRAFVQSQLPATPAPKPPIAVVTGAPRSPAPSSSALLRIGGAEVTHYRVSINGGPFGDEVPVSTTTVLTALPNGTNTIAVIGRNAQGLYQSTNRATVISWIVNTSLPTIRLNEVIAARSGGQRDQIELYNEGTAAADLTGLRLTDDRALPGKFTFGSASLAAGAFLVLDSAQLGFSFDESGEGLFLFDTISSGETLLDGMEYGAQIADLSLGRIGSAGEWHLTQPSFGAANILQPIADTGRVRINEWLAAGQSPNPDDFIELHNPESLPAAIGGSYLTDQAVGAPGRSAIRPHTFIPARGYLVFTSGNGSNADEFDFALSADQGEIALLDPEFSVIDSIVYGPQQLGVANGRCPDGTAAQKFLLTPTPGGPNECPVEPEPPVTITLVPFEHVWKYNRSGSDLGTAWKDTNYNDGAWPDGPALIGFADPDDLPEPLRTSFSNPRETTYYFRTTFQLDAALNPSSVQVRHIIDDGAAFYLNGEEIGTRFNLSPDARYQTPASRTVNDADYETFTIPPNLLRPGTNFLAVEVHQSSASSSDMVFGLELAALVVTNSAADAGVLINEVLANNADLTEADGSTPDWVEIYNPSSVAVDLTGMSLTDDLLAPARWLFLPGSILPARGFMRVNCDAEAPISSGNTGFGLKANGGRLFLFNRTNEGGGIQSSASYGLQAPNWSLGRVPDGSTNWVLTIPSAGISNLVATLGNAQNLKINEWMANPAAGEDWLEVFNPNPEPVDVSGLLLSDDLTQRDKHRIPPLSFIGNGAHAFQEFQADELAANGADHVAFKLSADGEALALSAPNGALIDGLGFGRQAAGVSQGRLLDGSTNVVSFATTASPGSANYLPLTSVVVNEVLTHSDAPLMDAVEFYNPTSQPVDVSGYFLSDSALNLRKYQLPSNTVIAPGGYLVIYEDRFNSDAASDPFSFNSARGDEVFLSQSVQGVFTGYRASASFGAAENGVSIGRIATTRGDHFVPLAIRTFGRDNPATTNEFALGTGAGNSTARISPVILNEVMYHPASTNEALEFVELHNRSAATAALYDSAHPTNTWRLRKGIEFEFPPGVTIAPGGFVVLVNFDPELDTANRAVFMTEYGSAARLFGPFRGKLDNSGERIELQKPDAPQAGTSDVPYINADALDYGAVVPWPTAASGGGSSLHRMNLTLYGNDPVHWTASSPSPGAGLATGADSDGDGMSNVWEALYGFNPNDASDAALDPDLDGLSNLQEYIAGTGPRNPAESLRLGASITSSGTVLEFRAVSGRSYTVLYSDDIPLGTWRVLSGPQSAGSSTDIEVTDSNPQARHRFYRLLVQPNP